MVEVKTHWGLVVTIRTGEDIKGRMRDQYGGFEILIESDAPAVLIEGCHDNTPDFVEHKGG